MALLLFISLFVTATLAQDCGNPAISPNVGSKVVGGVPAKPNSWPWQVSLQTWWGFHFCGGSIINQNWILTASHCVDGKGASDVYVIVGEHKLNVDAGTEVNHASNRIIMHERYNQFGLLNNDIALIKLDSPILFNQNVSPVCLPQQDLQLAHLAECYGTGWGDTKGTGDQQTLNQALLPAWTQEKCVQDTYWGSHANYPGKVCAGLDDGKSVCFGDSGGPLNCNVNGKWTVIGAASYVSSQDCYSPNHPSVYARVANYRNWVDDKMDQYGH